MKIVHATKSDWRGGAARAAFRVHRALRDHGVDSWMVVDDAGTGDDYVLSPTPPLGPLRSKAASRLNRLLTKLQWSPNPTSHSPALFSGTAARRVREQSPTLVNLHWLGEGFLSVREVGQLACPVVWRLPDMWPYCGAEHYDSLVSQGRWREGYTKENRPTDHRGVDIDRWTWNRKRRWWQRPHHIVAPSQWSADRAVESALLSDWPICVIPNPLPLDVFRPHDAVDARTRLGLPQDRPLVLFGADGGTRNHLKGFDLLEAAMTRVVADHPEVESVVFGEPHTASPIAMRPVHWMGRVDDDEVLALLYAACDVMVVPSRQEAFGQTGTEAQACGTPVVAFRDTGLEDVVSNGRTGYLAEALDVIDLARGISWTLERDARKQAAEARARAERLWAPDVVASQYLDVYESALSAEG